MILRQHSHSEQAKNLALNEAFFRLSNNSDFQLFKDWLESESDRITKENMTAEGTQYKRNQGALQTIFDILLYSGRNEAKKIIEKLRT